MERKHEFNKKDSSIKGRIFTQNLISLIQVIHFMLYYKEIPDLDASPDVLYVFNH